MTNQSKLNTLDNTDTETISAFRFRLLIELFYIGMPVVRTDGRSVGVRSRDYQIFSDG